MANKAIPIYKPFIDKTEEDLVTDCMKSTSISSKGAYIDKFEEPIITSPVDFNEILKAMLSH